MPGMTTGGFVAARAQPNLLLTTTAMSSSSSGGAGSTAWMHFIETFRFQPGTTPLADFYVPLLTCCTYLLTLVVLKAFIQHRGKAFDLKHVVTVYNFCMSFASGVLFFFLSRELLSIYHRQSAFELFCNQHVANVSGWLIFLYYVNYVFKYVELVDTVFLVLRARQTPFLHVYHHAITLCLCWTQLRVETCMQWVLISINLFVHIILYAYYGLYELRVDVWWKRWLTTLQIVQFLIALLASLAAMGLRVLYELTPAKWQIGAACHGNWEGSWFGLAIIISYLVLFIQLYKQRYEGERVAQAKMKRDEKAREEKERKQAMTPSKQHPAPKPDFSSTFSPHARTGVSSLPPPPPVGAPLSAPASLTLAEEQFGDRLQAWRDHPLLKADRERWVEHEEKVAREIQQLKDERGDDEEEISQTKSESQLKQRRFANTNPSNPGRL